MRILVILLIFNANIFAKDWIKINPLNFCKEFALEYYFDDGYKIRFKQSLNDEEYTYLEKKLLDINDLNTITDIITDASLNYCPFSIEIEIDKENSCRDIDDSTKPFSNDYVNFVKDVITGVDQKGNNCKDVIPLLKLQETIEQIDQKDLISFDKDRDLLNLFVGSEKDKMIDHYHECGGSSNSGTFIKNMILLESKNACLYQEPNGLLSFDQTLKIAEQVSKKYNKRSITSLGLDSDELIKDVIVTFTKEIITDQSKELFGEDVDTNEFLHNLDFYQNFKDLKDFRTLDYAAYILKIDAPLEIVEKGIPLLVENHYSSMLPQNLSKKEKNDFLNKKIIPIVKQRYSSCISSFKQIMRYPSKHKKRDDFKAYIKHRKKLESDFCKVNPEICKNRQCGQSINFGSTDPEVTDMNQIQACLFEGLTVSIAPMFKEIISSQKEEMSKYFSLTDSAINEMTDKNYDYLYQCMDQKIKTIAGIQYNESFTERNDVLKRITATDFTDTISKCALEVEGSLTKDFVTLLMGNMSAVKDQFGTNAPYSMYGIELDTGSTQFANEVMDSTIPACLNSQQEKLGLNPDFKVSYSICRPLIEVESGKKIISKNLENLFNDNNGNNSKSKKILDDFNNCVTDSKEKILGSIFNENSEHTISNQENIESHLLKNNSFYQCVKNSITETTKVISDISITNILNENKDSISNPKYVQNLKPEVIKLTSMCFKQELNRIKNWPEFLKFNETNGLSSLQKTCTNEATEFLLPKVVLSETKQQLLALSSTNIANKDEVALTIENISNKLADKYKINIPRNISIPKAEYILLESYKIIKRNTNNPELSIEEFISEITKTSKSEAVVTIHKNIIDSMKDLNKNYDLNIFSQAFNPTCLNQFYTINENKISTLISKIAKNSKPESPKVDLREEFAEYINKGLINAKDNNRFDILISNLEKVCKDPNNYKDLNKIVETGIADDILIGVIETKIKQSLLEINKNKCIGDFDEYGINISKSLKDDICNVSTNGKYSLRDFKKRFLDENKDPKQRVLFDFILHKKIDSDIIVNRDIDKELIEKILFENKDILNFVYTNFQDVASGESNTSTKLNKIIVEKLFSPDNKNKFSENFINNQLISGIGLAGYDIALEQIDEQINDINFLDKITNFESPDIIRSIFKPNIEQYTKPTFQEMWSFDSVKEYVAIDKMNKTNRDLMYDSVYNLALYPEVDETETDTSKKEKRDLLAVKISKILDTSKVHKNSDYVPASRRYNNNLGIYITTKAKGEPNLNFSQRLAQDIADKVTEKIVDGFKNKIGL